MSTLGWHGDSVHNTYSITQADGAAPISNDVPTVPEQKKALERIKVLAWKRHTAHVLTTHRPEVVSQPCSITKVMGSRMLPC